MKMQLVLIYVILFISESTIAQTSTELLSNKNLLSQFYRTETVKSVEPLMCSTGAYQMRYYDKVNGLLKFIIKYDCNDELTNSNYSCNFLSSEAVFEYIYNTDHELRKLIRYDPDLEIIGFEEFENRTKSFNEKEKLLRYLNEGQEDYMILKIILVDSKPFKTLYIGQDGYMSYSSNQKSKRNVKRSYQ